MATLRTPLWKSLIEYQYEQLWREDHGLIYQGRHIS